MFNSIQELKEKLYQGRYRILTSSLFSIDILVALYYGGILRLDPDAPEWQERDRFLISHAQISPALYAILGVEECYAE